MKSPLYSLFCLFLLPAAGGCSPLTEREATFTILPPSPPLLTGAKMHENHCLWIISDKEYWEFLMHGELILRFDNERFRENEMSKILDRMRKKIKEITLILQGKGKEWNGNIEAHRIARKRMHAGIEINGYITPSNSEYGKIIYGKLH
jgi:hypothetical protein